VGSGGVLSHAPKMEQTALMLIDGFEPEGITRLAKDSIFMMPHLGVLSAVHPKAATEVFVKDCLIYLGTCVAPKGKAKPGKPCLKYEVEFSGGRVEEGELNFGEMKLYPLGADETAKVRLSPTRAFDVGKGKGVQVEEVVHGGTVGLIFDCRGRPLVVPDEPEARMGPLKSWMTELNVYPEEALGG
jgi:hypothetical protein